MQFSLCVRYSQFSVIVATSKLLVRLHWLHFGYNLLFPAALHPIEQQFSTTGPQRSFCADIRQCCKVTCKSAEIFVVGLRNTTQELYVSMGHPVI